MFSIRFLKDQPLHISAEVSFYKEVETDEHGVFKVRLPLTVSKHFKRIKQCSVKLISSSEPFCGVASSTTSSSLHLKSRKERTDYIFSAGFFTFKPLTEPELCNQKPNIPTITKQFDSIKTFFRSPNVPIVQNPPPTLPPLFSLLPPPTVPVVQNPPPNLPPFFPLLPPMPTFPPLLALPSLPTLPAMPALPQLPALPKLPPILGLGQEINATIPLNTKENPLSDEKTFSLPTIPSFPSPSAALGIPMPPNHLQPPSLPNPFLPSPPAFNLPPILPPGIVPGITPPPPPTFAFPPFPPFPFLPHLVSLAFRQLHP
ncbi:hypothetical protein GIB67_000759 [Kingdonia uniflora]|uniref:Uncharacterized protein n=1 Tax=Kingdonia uniflora TaxID=39325 RepID=A0A7J7NDD1_9MAGN|nr:hypothetical protein GIB67_000759 [Kingdonia uniflora]